MAHQVVEVRKEAVAPCMTCPICRKLFRDATTIIECLHTFCRKCIYKKLSDEEMECCPICNIHLGCVPLEKLRPDHNLQDVRAKIFPNRRIKVKAPEVLTPTVLPAKRKERSLSSLVVSTPRVSTQVGMTGRRSKSIARKASKGSSFTIEKPVVSSVEDQAESSSSQEMPSKSTQNNRQNSSAGEPSNRSPDKERQNGSEHWEGKLDLWNPLTCLVEAANSSKSSKFSTQDSHVKSEEQNPYEKEGLQRKTKNKEMRKKSKIKDEKNSSDHTPPETETPKKLRRVRQKTQNFGNFRIPPQAVLDAASAKFDRKNNPIWFSLVATKELEGDAVPLPQISASYLRINGGDLMVMVLSDSDMACWTWFDATNDISDEQLHALKACLQYFDSDGSIPVSFIQNYLKRKLDLKNEVEVDIKCMGQTVIPTLTLNNLVDLWLQTTGTERVKTTIGSSAKEFVMVLDYARRASNS